LLFEACLWCGSYFPSNCLRDLINEDGDS
jgi:hypothetical protein